jgi:hypothetical protein
MANALAERIRVLQLEKIKLDNTEAGGHLVGYADAVLLLDDKSDAVTGQIGDNVDLDELAEAVVDIADIFDDADMNADNEAKLNAAVSKITKRVSGITDEQSEAISGLFTGVLAYGKSSRAENAYFNTLLAIVPDGN